MKRIIWLFALFLAGCGSNVAPAPIAQTATAPPIIQGPVVFIGDSITQYWPLADFFENTINAGIGGQVSAQMLARFDTDVLANHPSVVVILAGTNDIRINGSADPSNLYQMVTKAQASGARVIVGMLPPNENWLTPDTCSYCTVFIDRAAGMPLYVQFNEEIAAGAATYGYAIADYHSAMINPDGSQNATLFDSSLVHPNYQGYIVMADVLRPILAIAQAR